MRLGLDLGSTAVKGAVLDEAGKVVRQAGVESRGDAARAASALLDVLFEPDRGQSVRVGVTGRLRDLVTAACEAARSVPDIVALAAGAAHRVSGVADVISMGGHDAFWCRLDAETPGAWSDFALSDLCAAGAGSFLTQQAARLGLTAAALGEAAALAARAPVVAGRCAVFTKSDIIHLQQKGTPVDEIALGLCRALVRTFQTQVLHGRAVTPPLLFAGGCARNDGMVRAVCEVFGLSREAVILPDDPEMVQCVGAALSASTSDIPVRTLGAALSRARRGAGTPRWERLIPPGVTNAQGPRKNTLAESDVAGPQGEPAGRGLAADEPFVLGVDVGSVSTNLVLVDARGDLGCAVYLKTKGRPLAALQAGLGALSERLGRFPQVSGVAATGSGRHLAAHFLGADLVKNEIAAQLRAATRQLPEVDTVFEIGGQDAKYIRVERGRIADFAMNRICSAGTGSFLEEQAERLGLDVVGELEECAFRSDGPVDLGRRCTVFMESEVVAAQAAGATTADVAAGLALSVARNYLDRVVGGRPVGENVVFQGGTAANRAVTAAFARLLGRPVSVHPHCRVSGALGAALLLLDARAAGLREATRFRGAEACDGALERSFECVRCSARCQVTRFRSGASVFYFGDACERYSSGAAGRRMADPLARREQLLLEAAGIQQQPGKRLREPVGLIRASHTMALLPWFAALVRAAGREPVLSAPTTSETLSLGAGRLGADTCLPVKAAYGHAVSLEEAGISEILAPSVSALPGEEGRSASCLFGHHLPWMLAGALKEVSVIAPELAFDLPARYRALPSGVEAPLGLSKRAVRRALRRGDEASLAFEAAMSAWGSAALSEEVDRIVVVMGRPYLVSDPYLNMGVGRHLARMGLSVLPMDALPLSSVSLDEAWQDLPWRFTRDLVRAAVVISRDERLFPIVLSSFGCGPDAFALKHLDGLIPGRPRLVLEMDEHRSEAGLLTRLEAFADEIEAHVTARRAARPRRARPSGKLTPRSRLVMPHFADHVFGHAGIMRAAGYDVVVLPPPDHRIREKGESMASGRECHPFALVAGDLINWLESDAARAGDVYFYPGTVVSCLLRQYRDGLDQMLQRLGAERVRIVTPSLDSWIPLVGLRLTVRMQAVQAAGDALVRALCRIRPYERHPGETDAVYRDCLNVLSAAAEAGTHFEALETIARRLGAVERAGGSGRPVVGVAGDLYTRINDFASDGLFRRLEAAGLEVWPAPFGTDVAGLNAMRRRQAAWRLKRPVEGVRYTMAGRIMAKQTRRIDAIFSRIANARPEPSAAEMAALAVPYLGAAATPLMALNIGRMLVYARDGAAGILNASCINCMVGSASEAFHARMRQDIGTVPFATLVYGGSSGTVNQARLEGFVQQVRRRAGLA